MSNIEACKTQFARHPFFALLRDRQVDVSRFFGALSFWVFTFPDVLRTNHGRAQAPEIAKELRDQWKIDTGHEKWFVNDWEIVTKTPFNFAELSDYRLTEVRQATFDIMDAAMRTSSDCERVALVQALEAAGKVFFDRTAEYFAPLPEASKMKYFIGVHTKIEEYHADEMDALIQEYFSSLGDVAQADHMRARIFKAFDLMFDGVAAACRSVELQAA